MNSTLLARDLDQVAIKLEANCCWHNPQRCYALCWRLTETNRPGRFNMFQYRWATALLAILVTSAMAAAQAPFLVGLPGLWPQIRMEQLLTRWKKEQEKFQTLSVEFTAKRKNPVFPNAPAEQSNGRLVAKKRPEGAVDFVLELRSANSANPSQKLSYVDGSLYVYREEEKVILEIPDQNPEALISNFPLSLFLDAKSLRKNYDAKVAKIDALYSYIELLPKTLVGRQSLSSGRVAVLNKASESIPQDMPRQIHWIEPNNFAITYDIRKWQFNVPSAIRGEDFEKPKPLAGWEMKRVDGISLR